MSLISASTPLLADVRQLIDSARQRVASTVNAELTQLYWQIGSRVNAELLKGQRAEYGKQVVVELAQQLTTEFGKGWSERQLRYCLRIAEVFPDAQILHTLCSQLSWSHLNCDLKKPEETIPQDLTQLRAQGQQGEATPIGLILCTGKSQEHVELLQLQQSNIRVADYLTLLPSREVLQTKLHQSIELARAKLNLNLNTAK